MRSKLQRPRVGVCAAAVCAAAVLAAAIILLLPLGGHRFEASHQRSATVARGTFASAADKVETRVRARAVESYGRLSLSFEANQGQTDRRVKFLSRGSGYSLFLTGNEAVLALKKPGARSPKSVAPAFRPAHPGKAQNSVSGLRLFGVCGDQVRPS